jgi:hypothetical protein
VRLHRALKALEGAQCGRHGFRRDEAGVEDAAAEARDFAVFGKSFELVRVHPGDLQPAGVGTDIDGGECRHEVFGCAPWRKNRPIAKIHEGMSSTGGESGEMWVRGIGGNRRIAAYRTVFFRGIQNIAERKRLWVRFLSEMCAVTVSNATRVPGPEVMGKVKG